jgi:hypothetical protein
MHIAHPIESSWYNRGNLNRIANRPNANKNGNSPSLLAGSLFHSGSSFTLFQAGKNLAPSRSSSDPSDELPHAYRKIDHLIDNLQQLSINYIFSHCMTDILAGEEYRETI